jgi:hypothetical protein
MANYMYDEDADEDDGVDQLQDLMSQVVFRRGAISFRASSSFQLQSKTTEAQMIEMMGGMPPQSEAGALHEMQQAAK